MDIVPSYFPKSITIEPTESARSQFLDPNERIIHRASVVGVLGISQTEKEATVLFSYQFKKSEFDYFIRDNDRKRCPTNEIMEDEINLIKYDTGWRVKK